MENGSTKNNNSPAPPNASSLAVASHSFVQIARSDDGSRTTARSSITLAVPTAATDTDFSPARPQSTRTDRNNMKLIAEVAATHVSTSDMQILWHQLDRWKQDSDGWDEMSRWRISTAVGLTATG